MTDLRDRMRGLEHERERDPEISAPERLRARVQELGNEYEEVLRANADRRAWRTYGMRRPWTTGRAWPRCATCADPTRSVSTTPSSAGSKTVGTAGSGTS